ncbi:hypothetical protein C5468_18410 [Photorhabdus luminescens subsp. mexicana]|uniref:Uncharacterized protein n=1 Tax=Photorhabdus luminescens subsp. mexicana TaxID=2100167 RepID=A0A4R4J2E9_PHOLU|nr:hypothetical protein C5468_18410 [Photorhabdus luminescens subsp. mexicana]
MRTAAEASLTDNSLLLHHYLRKNLPFHCYIGSISLIKYTIRQKKILLLLIIHSNLKKLYFLPIINKKSSGSLQKFLFHQFSELLLC